MIKVDFLPSKALLPTIALLPLLPCHDIPSHIACFEIANVDVACIKCLIEQGRASKCILVVLDRDG